ncbi:hypothetical protein DFJ73DRAFT_777510 [Zopfochytrium polystomum]|nr:hypothetical protein DFJ73DRAFT_777510 [Zopfochytrium polystomum]
MPNMLIFSFQAPLPPPANRIPVFAVALKNAAAGCFCPDSTVGCDKWGVCVLSSATFDDTEVLRLVTLARGANINTSKLSPVPAVKIGTTSCRKRSIPAIPQTHAIYNVCVIFLKRDFSLRNITD